MTIEPQPARRHPTHAKPAVARVGSFDCVLEAAHGTSVRIDRAGRWFTARIEDRRFRRTLDGGAVVYEGPQRVPSDVEDIAATHQQVAALTGALHDQLRDPAEPVILGGDNPSRKLLVDYLARARRWTAARFQRERAKFIAAYAEPVEILPPDRYLDIVVQPAVGCPNGRCSFCIFYRNRPLRQSQPEAFRAHLRAVCRLFGAALPLKTGVFLGSASALSLPQQRVLEVLKEVNNTLGSRQRGVAAFWDPDHSPCRTASDWAALHERGLAAVYIGLETGLPRLRERIGKSPNIDRLVKAVTTQGSTGLRTGVIVLAGVGGPDVAAAHREATSTVVEGLALSRSDIVYVSPLKGSLPPDDLRAEQDHLISQLKNCTAAKVAPYAMEVFRYYA